ncbi:hypothetical protein HY333_01970 [Candidatus Collierbacteria bacterium]|nr:hypothetical protein [Candidatus Collierbacteria bacterium]
MVGSKEQEQPSSADEQALKEVEGYIERIERQSEVKSAQSPLQPAPQVQQAPASVVSDMGQIVLQSAQKVGKPKIVLPLTEDGIKKGLHHKMIDGVRWLAEWCIFMIKKYPGRVFYKS